MNEPVAPQTKVMAAIALAVSAGAALSPATLVGAYGIAPREVTGAGALGWRLFAVRTGWLGLKALQGDTTARDAFLPVQLLDQVVFAHAYRTRSIPRPAAVLAMLTSGAIIAADVSRRAGGPPRTTGR